MANKPIDIEAIEAIKADIRASLNDNKIDCERARGLAQQHGISTRAMGEIIDEMGIKIRNCGLGCF